MLFRSTLSVVAQTSVAGSNGGLFSISSTGQVTFDPNGEFEALAAGETDTTTLSYQISDGEGGFDTATITVTIGGDNDAPSVDNNPGNQTGADADTIPGTSAPIDVPAIFGDADATDSLTFAVTGLPLGLTYNAGTGEITGTIDSSASQGEIGRAHV